MKTLDELAEVKRGKSRHRPRTAAALYGGSHPFIQTADIHASEFRILKCSQSYSDFGLAQSKKWKAGTLCITNAGENTGDCAILGFDACFPDSIIGVTPIEGKADVRFLKYSLDLLRPQLRTVTKGATQDNLSVAILLSFPFPAPDLTTQRKIAGILSAYDDLIENNLRRIKILEQMAQSLYREWFVRFRFPGHEAVTFKDTELGRIPEGWKHASLGSLCKTVREKYDDSRDSDLPLLDLSRMPSQTLAPSEFGSSSDLGTSRILFKPGDTLFGTIRPYLHKVCRAPFEGITNVSVFVLRPHDSRCSALVSIICSSSDAIQWAVQHSTGLKMPVIKWDQLAKFPISLAPVSILIRFDLVAAPIMDEISSLSRRNQVLRRTRDLLLPKLLTSDE